MARRLNSTTRWLRWLTPGLQIKRWLVLLMVSELVLVLGVAYALQEIYQTAHLPSGFYYITLQFLPYWARAIMFGIFGVGLLLVSYLKLTQSVLGPFLPATRRPAWSRSSTHSVSAAAVLALSRLAAAPVSARCCV